MGLGDAKLEYTHTNFLLSKLGLPMNLTGPSSGAISAHPDDLFLKDEILTIALLSILEAPCLRLPERLENLHDWSCWVPPAIFGEATELENMNTCLGKLKRLTTKMYGLLYSEIDFASLLLVVLGLPLSYQTKKRHQTPQSNINRNP